jgi:hypothetical protein
MEMTNFDFTALGEYKEGNRTEAKKATPSLILVISVSP